MAGQSHWVETIVSRKCPYLKQSFKNLRSCIHHMKNPFCFFLTFSPKFSLVYVVAYFTCQTFIFCYLILIYLWSALVFVYRLYLICGDEIPILVQVTCDMKQKYAKVCAKTHMYIKKWTKVCQNM